MQECGERGARRDFLIVNFQMLNLGILLEKSSQDDRFKINSFSTMFLLEVMAVLIYY